MRFIRGLTQLPAVLKQGFMKTEVCFLLGLSGLIAVLVLAAGCRTANDSDRPWSQPVREESILNMGPNNQPAPRVGSHYP
jgi:hypothetical protein